MIEARCGQEDDREPGREPDSADGLQGDDDGATEDDGAQHPRGRRPGIPDQTPSRCRREAPLEDVTLDSVRQASGSGAQAGRRFSMNARKPSWASSLTRCRAITRAVCHFAEP
jgi:hypothetical protein